MLTVALTGGKKVNQVFLIISDVFTPNKKPSNPTEIRIYEILAVASHCDVKRQPGQ